MNELDDPPTATVNPPPMRGQVADDTTVTTQRVRPLRRPGRWIATVVVLVVVAQIAHGLVTNPFFQWHRFGYWFVRPVIVDGLVVT